MIKIRSIKPKKGEQAVVTVETKTATIPHVTTLHLVLKYHLEEGMSLSQEQYETFIKDNEFELLYQKAVSYISYQMRTVSEVKKKLRKTTSDEALINKLISLLKSQQYIGDVHYVNEYVTQKINFDLVGPKHIKDKLIQKGVHYDIIDGELSRYTEQMEYSKVEELLMRELKYPPKKPYYKFIDSFKRKCVNKGFHLGVVDSIVTSFKDDIIAMIDEKALLEKELSNLKTVPTTYEEKQQLIAKLRRKGFSYPIIQEHVK